MTEKSKAQRLADLLDAEQLRTVSLDIMHNDAATELRRLDALVGELREDKGRLARDNACYSMEFSIAHSLLDDPEYQLTGVDFDYESALHDKIKLMRSKLRRLDRHEQVNTEWLEKTEWVQKTLKPKELGIHRADILKKRIDDLTALNAELVERLQQMCDETEQGFISTMTRVECRILIAKAKEQT